MSNNDQSDANIRHRGGQHKPSDAMQHGGQPANYTHQYGPAYTGGGQYNQSGPNRGLQWVSASNGHIPPNAVQGGIEKDGRPLFVARTMHKGGLRPAKVGQHLENGGCNFAYGNKEIAVSEYQILCGDASRLRWVRQEGSLDINGFVPFPAGHEETGEPLYIAKALYENSQQLGSCALHLKKGMLFPYGHKERSTSHYMVLAYAD